MHCLLCTVNMKIKACNAFSAIRQLGIPTLFISLSAADTKWLELLQSIYKLTNKKNITNEQLEKMPWNEKCNLISKDPGTCALYFNHRVKKFIKHILKSPYSPFGKLLNFSIVLNFNTEPARIFMDFCGSKMHHIMKKIMTMKLLNM